MIEIGEKVVRRWYRSSLPGGGIWCESSDPDEVVRMSVGHGCTYVQFVTYEETRREAWAPLECVNARCCKHYGGPDDWSCAGRNPGEDQ